MGCHVARVATLCEHCATVCNVGKGFAGYAVGCDERKALALEG
jgi:hypothetical protein